ncbi:MAG: hypothetical protein Q9214_001407, partial [Letrouitia sp. 1 TL-2023]
HWTLKLCWKDVNKEFEEKLDAFRNHVKSVEKEANLLSMVETHEGWSVAANNRKLKRRQQILSLLSEIRYTSKHQNERKKRHPGSGSWFIDPSSVIDILANKILQRDITEPVALYGEVPNEKPSDARPAVIYHYCEFSDLDSMEPTIILGTLIRQLLETITIPEALCQQIERYRTPRSRQATPEELFAVLQDALLLFSEIYILIDGLDECPTKDIHVVLLLFNSLFQLDHSSWILKLVIFSRHIGAVSQCLTNYTSFEMSIDRISLDIDAYIESTVRSKISYRESEVSDIPLEKEIIETLKEGAHGITKTTLAQQVFKWTVCAKRPMSLAELAEAVAFSYTDSSWSEEKIPKPSRLYEACRNLIVLNEEDDTVRLVHHTFEQLLLEQPQHQMVGTFHIPLPEADIEVGEICVAYLSFSDFERQVMVSNRQALPISYMPEPTTIMKQVIFPSRLNNVATSILQATNYLRPRNALSHSLDFDLLKFAKLRVPPSHELRNKYALLGYVIRYWTDHTSAFHWRRARTWKSFRRLALDKNLPFDVRPWGDIDESKKNTYEGLIQWAVDAEHLPLLHLLPNGCSITDAVVAQGIRKDNLPLIEVLTMKGANPNARSENGITILQWAALRGHMTFLEPLVSLGADTEAAGPNGRTALILAAHAGLISVVEKLISMKAYIDAKDDFGETALHMAVGRGYVSTVEFLLAKGADIEAKDSSECTPLRLAVFKGYTSIVQVLLAKGANIKAKDYAGETALHLASRKGHKSIVEILLANGPDIEPELHLAASEGHESTVEVLLTKGADVEAKNDSGYTALHLAADQGHESTVEVLLIKGANIEAKHDDGYTALNLAAYSGHELTVSILVAKGADIEAENSSGNTALQHAALNGQKSMVSLLVAKGAYGGQGEIWKNGTAPGSQ